MTHYFGRIPVDEPVSQDFGFGHWPRCKPPRMEQEVQGDIYSTNGWLYSTRLPTRVFLCKDENGYSDCVANGYGFRSVPTSYLDVSDTDGKIIQVSNSGEYGNGSLHVFCSKNIERCSYQDYIESELEYNTLVSGQTNFIKQRNEISIATKSTNNTVDVTVFIGGQQKKFHYVFGLKGGDIVCLPGSG